MYLGVDIGGTKTLIALFSKRGRILRRRKIKTAHGYKTFIRELEENLADFQKFRVRGVAVAIPGIVQKNYTVSLGNRNWGEIDILGPIKKLFDCPVWLENDASLGALYEGHKLPGRTMFLTFSTGIGGGLVEDNRILPESQGFEPGHRKYEYEGQTKEWEDIAAASALEGAYHVDYATNLRGKKIMQDVAKRVYLGIPDVVREHSPKTIILGGPLGKIFKLYAKYLPEMPGVSYRRPKRPNESVIYGCYLLAKQKGRE